MFKRWWGDGKESMHVCFQKLKDWVAKRQRHRIRREMKKAE